MMQFEDLGIKTKPGQRRYATICPNCNETRKHKNRPSLTVNDEAGNRWYKCWSCGFSGNLDVQDKYDKVKEKSKMPTKEKVFTQKVRQYLEQRRGFTMNTAKEFGLYEVTNKYGTMLGFPFYMNHTLVNVKFLNIDWKEGDKGPKWFQLPQDIGTRIIPFGMQMIRWDDEDTPKKKIIIITEGEWDTIAWWSAGYRNVISVPQGAPSLKAKDFTKEFAYMQDTYVKSVFAEAELFYISTDGDEPGKNLRSHLSMILGKEKCRYIQYPAGYKDMNEVWFGNEKKKLPALGKPGVDNCYNNVAAIPIKGIIRPSDVFDELKIYREIGFTPGLGCGVPEIDRLYTVKPKHVQFITGVPSSGKSVYVRWWLTEMIKHNIDLDLRWAMFTPENRPVSREMAKIAEALTGQSFRKDSHNAMNDEVYRQSLRFVQKHFSIISPDRKNFENFGIEDNSGKLNTLATLFKYLEYLKKTTNLFGFVIDAWNKVEHEQPKFMTETQFISQQLDILIDFCAYWDLHGIVVVHPKKIELQGVNYRMPSLYDIKGSSAWKEKADIGIIIHRYKLKKKSADELTGNEDEDEKWKTVHDAPNILRTEKIRFEELGIEDRVRLKMVSGGRFVVDTDKTPVKDSKDAVKMKKFYETDDKDDEEDDGLPF